MFDAYDDWGRDAKIILSHIKDPSRWMMHAVDPPLEHYVKEKVVLIGDAVSGLNPIIWQSHLKDVSRRPMPWFRTLVLGWE